jgi:hypothetical protein
MPPQPEMILWLSCYFDCGVHLLNRLKKAKEV